MSFVFLLILKLLLLTLLYLSLILIGYENLYLIWPLVLIDLLLALLTLVIALSLGVAPASPLIFLGILFKWIDPWLDYEVLLVFGDPFDPGILVGLKVALGILHLLLLLLLALLQQILYLLGARDLYLKSTALILISHRHGFALLHVFAHSLPLRLPVIQLLFFFLFLHSLTFQIIFLLLFFPRLFLFGSFVHALQNLVPLLFQLRLPLGLHILIMTLHFIFVFFNFLEIILINMMLVRLRIPFYQQAAVVFVVGSTRLLGYVPLLLLAYQLILPDKWRRLLRRVPQLDLIYLREHVLSRLVDTESLLLVDLRDRLLRLLALDDEILKLLFGLRLAFFWWRSQLPLFFNRLG